MGPMFKVKNFFSNSLNRTRFIHCKIDTNVDTCYRHMFAKTSLPDYYICYNNSGINNFLHYLLCPFFISSLFIFILYKKKKKTVFLIAFTFRTVRPSNDDETAVNPLVGHGVRAFPPAYLGPSERLWERHAAFAVRCSVIGVPGRSATVRQRQGLGVPR